MRACRKFKETDKINFVPKPNQSAIILSSLPDNDFQINMFLEEDDEGRLSSTACDILIMREVLNLEESDPIYKALVDRVCRRGEEDETSKA